VVSGETRCRAWPLGRIVQMSPIGGLFGEKSAPVKAICFPSGDQDGLKLVWGPSSRTQAGQMTG
jgi:hypothetical protein